MRRPDIGGRIHLSNCAVVGWVGGDPGGCQTTQFMIVSPISVTDICKAIKECAAIYSRRQGFRMTIVVTRRSPSCRADYRGIEGNGAEDLTLSTEARGELLLRKYVTLRNGWIACCIKVRLIDDLIDDSLSSQHRPSGVACRKFGLLVRSLPKVIWDILERKSIEKGTVKILTKGYRKDLLDWNEIV